MKDRIEYEKKHLINLDANSKWLQDLYLILSSEHFFTVIDSKLENQITVGPINAFVILFPIITDAKLFDSLGNCLSLGCNVMKDEEEFEKPLMKLQALAAQETVTNQELAELAIAFNKADTERFMRTDRTILMEIMTQFFLYSSFLIEDGILDINFEEAKQKRIDFIMQSNTGTTH